MHYGSVVGQKSDAEEFKKLCRVDVKILNYFFFAVFFLETFFFAQQQLFI
jgi:hypothetical protein